MQGTTRVARLAGTVVLLALLSCSAGAMAQAYPVKPVRVIVPFPPGGPVDLIGRPAAQKLTEALGQPFVVDYKPGAAGMLGSEHVAKSAADGYTLLVFSSGHTMNPSTQKAIAYDTLKDFAAVTPIGRSDIIVVTNPKLPVNNLKELIALAKARPGKLNFASSGAGGPLHLGAELLKVVAGIDMLHIPYKGAAPALQDVMAGTADLAFVASTLGGGLVKSGKVRMIAVASLKRMAAFPDVPTVEENGFPRFEVSSGGGLVTPAGTPRSIINQLNGTMEKILATAEIKQIFGNVGLEPWWLPPEQLETWLHNEVDKWQKVTRAIKFQPE